MSGPERRQQQRFDKTIPVRLKFGGTDDFLRAYTENISLGGVFVPTNIDVPIGTRVDLTVELAPGKGLQVVAEVVWQRPARGGAPQGVGLRFVQLKDQHQVWLEAAVARYAAEHPEAAAADPEPMQPAHQLRRAVGGVELEGASFDTDDMQLVAGSDLGDLIVGIDLGTSNSCACVCTDGEPLIVELEHDHQGEASATIPSVVAYDDHGGYVVGQAALDGLTTNARRTIYGSKRFVGRSYDHPDVQAMLSRYPYKVVPGPGRRCAVEINGRPVNLASVAAKILTALKEKAQLALERPVNRAIITVPAFYNQNQRQAVTQAGRLAGLTVERIVNEPTAAAIAYGLTYTHPTKILVYDLGGGTFDVSVMHIEGGALNVLANAGDTFLGGEDFDEAILGAVAARFHEKHGAHLSRNHAALAIVKQAVERAKCRLTLREHTMVMVREAVLTNNATQRLEIEISRAEVERLVEPLVDRTLKICDMALGEAQLARTEIDDVILVGGQTLMPYVQRRVGDHFGKRPRYDLRADEVVALGAGLLTDMHRRHGDDAPLKDALSMSIGIGLGGGRFKKLIERNTPVPCRVAHGISVPRKQLATYKLEVYQGEAPEVQRNEHLGTLELGDLASGRDDPVPLSIELMLSPDSLLKVRATNLATDREIDVLLDTRDMA